MLGAYDILRDNYAVVQIVERILQLIYAIIIDIRVGVEHIT
jgi:hypothetical protein